MCLKYFVIAVPILMVTFFNPLIYFLSIYTYCKGEMLPTAHPDQSELMSIAILPGMSKTFILIFDVNPDSENFNILVSQP